MKKILQHRCFTVKFAKFLRTPILKNICERLLLKIKYCKCLFLIKNSISFLLKYWAMCGITQIFIYLWPLLSTISKKKPVFIWRPLKGTVMQIEKALIIDYLRVSKVSWKFHILIVYSFAGIFLWNFLFFKKVVYFLTVSIVFSVYKKILWLNNS